MVQASLNEYWLEVRPVATDHPNYNAVENDGGGGGELTYLHAHLSIVNYF
jgi:hypothetical protein